MSDQVYLSEININFDYKIVNRILKTACDRLRFWTLILLDEFVMKTWSKTPRRKLCKYGTVCHNFTDQFSFITVISYSRIQMMGWCLVTIFYTKKYPNKRLTQLLNTWNVREMDKNWIRKANSKKAHTHWNEYKV